MTEEPEPKSVRMGGRDLQGGDLRGSGCPELSFSTEGRQEEESVPHQPAEVRG